MAARLALHAPPQSCLLACFECRAPHFRAIPTSQTTHTHAPKPLTRPATLLAPPLQEPDAELLVTMLEAADELLDIAEGPKLLPLEEVGARGCRACAFLV